MVARRGQRRRKVEIQSLVETVDSPGGIVRSYVTYATRWMSIEIFRGEQKIMDDQIYVERSMRFTTDWDQALKDLTFSPEKRLALSNLDSPETFRYFDIVEIRNWGQMNRYLEIIAIEKNI